MKEVIVSKRYQFLIGKEILTTTENCLVAGRKYQFLIGKEILHDLVTLYFETMLMGYQFLIGKEIRIFKKEKER